MNKLEVNRRAFLEFMGRGAALTGLATLSSCALPAKISEKTKNKQMTEDLTGPSNSDDFLTVAGIGWYPLISWGQIINLKKDKFGFNNDFIAYTPINGSNEGVLWVNHEYPNPIFLHGEKDPFKKSRDQVLTEKANVGGSLIHVKMGTGDNKQYEIVKNSPYNRRIDATTHIPFDHPGKLLKHDFAVGTLANCAGGVTPWGTILTCEENYDDYYGEWDFKNNKKTASSLGWDRYFDYSPLHYGWVVEVEPLTGKAIKRISLGRFAHECATVSKSADGKIVVYMGDDHNDEHIYKFISDNNNSLEKGTLYVANLEKGEWLPLKYENSELLKKNFEGQIEVLIRAREASKLLGATPLDRPEDVEIDPITKNIFISLTDNKPKGNYFGSILKIEEVGGDHGSLRFKSSVFLAGGPETGFACPDNLCFDKKGNLWMTTDISGPEMNQGKYESFKNNGLFFIPMSGVNAGKALQVASAPTDAELTGPCFSPDGKTLFLSVQHPGETSPDIFHVTSRWPSYSEGGIPKPTVICLYGPYFNS
ncbi:MAG: PhoX family protein [Bacteriovoracaceae bacterium]